MKPLVFSILFRKKLQEIKRRDKKLFSKISKQLVLFEQNPRYASLRLHKLKGNLQNTWSISVDRNHRLLLIDDEISYYFIKVGTHDEVYKK